MEREAKEWWKGKYRNRGSERTVEREKNRRDRDGAGVRRKETESGTGNTGE